MDKMIMERMTFYGYHGVFPEETKLGQQFVVDVELRLDLSVAARSDNLADTVNYFEMYGLVREIVEGAPYKLIETVAERIASEILQTYTGVIETLIRVTKPHPPFPIQFQGVTIEIQRKRG